MHWLSNFELSVCILFLFTMPKSNRTPKMLTESVQDLERLDEVLILMIEVIVQKRAMNICVAAVCEYPQRGEFSPLYRCLCLGSRRRIRILLFCVLPTQPQGTCYLYFQFPCSKLVYFATLFFPAGTVQAGSQKEYVSYEVPYCSCNGHVEFVIWVELCPGSWRCTVSLHRNSSQCWSEHPGLSS